MKNLACRWVAIQTFLLRVLVLASVGTHVYALDISLLDLDSLNAFDREKYLATSYKMTIRDRPNVGPVVNNQQSIELNVESGKYTVVQINGLKEFLEVENIRQNIGFYDSQGTALTELDYVIFPEAEQGRLRIISKPTKSFAVGFTSSEINPIYLRLDRPAHVVEDAIINVEQEDGLVSLIAAHIALVNNGQAEVNFEVHIGSIQQADVFESAAEAQIVTQSGNVVDLQHTQWGTLSATVPYRSLVDERGTGTVSIMGSLVHNGRRVNKKLFVPIVGGPPNGQSARLLPNNDRAVNGVLQATAVGEGLVKNYRVEFVFGRDGNILGWQQAYLVTLAGNRARARVDVLGRSTESFNRVRVKLINVSTGWVEDSYELSF